MNTQPFNVEIFDRSFNLKQHYNIDHVDYKYDYLSIVENTIFVPYNENVKKGDYIRVKGAISLDRFIPKNSAKEVENISLTGRYYNFVEFDDFEKKYIDV